MPRMASGAAACVFVFSSNEFHDGILHGSIGISDWKYHADKSSQWIIFHGEKFFQLRKKCVNRTREINHGSPCDRRSRHCFVDDGFHFADGKKTHGGGDGKTKKLPHRLLCSYKRMLIEKTDENTTATDPDGFRHDFLRIIQYLRAIELNVTTSNSLSEKGRSVAVSLNQFASMTEFISG